MPQTKEELTAKRRAYFLANRESILAKKREYKRNNRDKTSAYNREWYKKNAESAYKRHLKWRRENKERIAQYSKKYSEQLPWIRILSLARKRAQKKNLAYDLTNEWAKEKWTGLCEISGQPMRLGIGRQCLLSPSLDRIDSKLGYIQSNCRFVCLAMNAGRGDAKDDEFFALIRATAKHIGPG